MGNFYRVSVENEDGATVLELMAPAEMLREFAGAAVMRALGVTASEPDNEPAPAPATDQESGNYGPGQPQRRRRRTKAEMEAARAAETGAPANDPLHTVEDQAAPAPVATQPEAPVPAPEYKPFG